MLWPFLSASTNMSRTSTLPMFLPISVALLVEGQLPPNQDSIELGCSQLDVEQEPLNSFKWALPLKNLQTSISQLIINPRKQRYRSHLS